MLRAEIKFAEPTIPATAPASNPPSATQSSFTTTTPSSPLNAVSSSIKLHTDAVVGIAVGGAAFIAIVGLTVRICFRVMTRRRQIRQEIPATGRFGY
jgi:hypothetical protein